MMILNLHYRLQYIELFIEKYVQHHLNDKVNMAATLLDLRYGPSRIDASKQVLGYEFIQRAARALNVAAPPVNVVASEPMSDDEDLPVYEVATAESTPIVEATVEQQLADLTALSKIRLAKDANVIAALVGVPAVQRVARRILCIPASESAAERVFSVVKQVMPSSRAAMSVNMLTRCVFLKSNK